MGQLPASLKVVGQAIVDWWDDWVNLAVINLVWALCWLTLVLGPPATFGLYHVTNQLVRGQSAGLRGLLEGMRRYFFKSWAWMLLNVLVVVLAGANLNFYGRMEAAWAGVVLWLMLFAALLWLVVQFYALPFLMEQEQARLGMALRNGLFTALAAPGYTLVVVGISALMAGISLAVVAPLLLGGPCLIATIGNRAVRERLVAFGVRQRAPAQGEVREG